MFGTVAEAGCVAIITEYAAKGSTYDYLKDKTSLPHKLADQWSLQAARAIQYIQKHHIVHRDIKSSNYVIMLDNTLKLCDFGIAKYLTSTKPTGSERGTVIWLAPEVFTDNILSPKADIFAFGIFLWELQTCEEPYKGMSTHFIMFQVGMYKMRPDDPKNAPKFYRVLMRECWAQDREKRPPIDDIVDRLEKRYRGPETIQLGRPHSLVNNERAHLQIGRLSRSHFQS